MICNELISSKTILEKQDFEHLVKHRLIQFKKNNLPKNALLTLHIIHCIGKNDDAYFISIRSFSSNENITHLCRINFFEFNFIKNRTISSDFQ